MNSIYARGFARFTNEKTLSRITWMWCAQCQADVATEISGDGQALLCTTCNNEVRKGFTPSLHPETKSARDLLEKWAKEQTSESTDEETVITNKGQNADNNPVAAEADTTHQQDNEQSLSSKPKFRVDGSHEIPGRSRPKRRPGARPVTTSASAESKAPSEQTQQPVEKKPQIQPASEREYHRVDSYHPSPARPHFDVNRMPHERTRSGRAEILWGQLLAYSGVGVLTVGTVLVLWGYFGAIESYASTGWLIATAGQMLLLLGIVTLVGGGMQQTTHEVTERIEDLGGRILRIEDSTSRIMHNTHRGNEDSLEDAA